jgi:hypothetical protein
VDFAPDTKQEDWGFMSPFDYPPGSPTQENSPTRYKQYEPSYQPDSGEQSYKQCEPSYKSRLRKKEERRAARKVKEVGWDQIIRAAGKSRSRQPSEKRQRRGFQGPRITKHN